VTAAAPPRQTLSRAATVEGIGLHFGRRCRLTFRPARAGSGVVFRRTDLPGAPTVRADVRNAVLVERRTQLGEGAGALHTVEHVLSAVVGAAVDDVEIEMDAPEPPILDGSAGPFLDALEGAGVVASGGTAQVLELGESVRVADGESAYEAFPASALELEVEIDFPHPRIGRQRGRYVVTRESYARELARARTFGFVREVETLRAQGLIRGASTENAVVLDECDVVGTALRWPDEFVRHKAMDCVGDLALAGARVRARVVAVRPSHRGTVMLVRAMTAAARR
jgi:UDP-3-O-acyl N-acetylglucosamine deacetylase